MAEDNPIEGLDPNQSAFEPMLDMMNQDIPEDLSRTTTTTTLYISGDQTQIDQPRVSTTTTMAPVETLDIVSQFRQSNPEVNVGDVNKVIPNASYEERMQLLFDYPDQFAADIEYNNKINSYVTQLKDQGYKDDQILSYLEQQKEGKKSELMKNFPDLFDVKSIKRKDNVLKAIESENISYSRLLKFGSESKLKSEYPEFANLIDQKKKNDKIQKEIKAQEKKEEDELQREIEELEKAIETGKGLFDQDLSFTQIAGFRKRLRELKGEQTLADLDANDPFQFQADTARRDIGKISYKEKPVTDFEFKRIDEFNVEPIVNDYRFMDKDKKDQELLFLDELNKNIRATGGTSLSDEQIREVYVDGTKPFNESYKEYDDKLWNSVSGIVSTEPVVDLNDDFFERHNTTRDEFINERKLILSSGLFNTQKLGETYYTEEEFQAMYDRASEKLINEYGSTIGTYEKITGTNLRENPEQFYDESRKSSSLYTSDIDEDIVIGDSEQTSKNLRKRFGFLPYGSKDEAENYLETEGFRFSYDGDNLVIQSTITPESKSSPELVNGIEINMNGSDVYAKIKKFMSKAIITDDIKSVMNEYERGEGRFKGKFNDPMRAAIDLSNYILSKPHVFGDANGFATDGYGQGFLFGLIPMGGGKSKSDFMMDMSIINTQINALKAKDPISNKYLIDQLNKNLQYAQYINEEKAPELVGLKGVALAALSGVTETGSGITEGVVDLIIDIPFAPVSNIMSEDEVNMLKEFDLEEYQILDIQNKRIKDEVEYGIDEWINNTTAVTDKSLADAGLTYELMKTMIHSLSTGAIVGFNPSLVPVAFGLQTTARVENELKDSDLTNFEKRLISWPMATFEGILEQKGLQSALGPGKSKLFRWVAARALKNLPKNASLHAIEGSMKYTLKGLSARTILGIIEGGSYEALTELGQEAVEFTEKNIVNMLLDKEVFKNMPDITTEKGAKQFLDQLGKAAVLGFGAGSGISTISGTTNLLSNGFKLKGLNKSFENQYNIITSEEGRAIALAQINLAYQSKQITKEDANARIKAMNDAYPLMMEIPAELSSGQKRQSYDLMLERKVLEAEVKDKDKNLVVKQTERIAEINNQLQQISKTDAIQEQETKKEVLPDEQSEMGLQEVGEGDTQEQEAAEVQQEQELEKEPIVRQKTEEYVKELEDIKQSDPEQYWSVDSVSLEDAKEGTVVSVEGGKGIVGPDGDIKGVFKSKDSKAEKVADKILEEAVNNGGTKLDNFDNYLTRIYKRNGFRVASRTPFNEEFAPDGWNKEKHGTPDVVAMVYDPESKLDIEEKTFDDTETGYDEMIAYRDSFIETPVAEQVTKEVVEDITPEVAENIKNIEKQADNARKAISKVLPGVEIITHSTEDSYRKATGKTDSKKQSGRGEYNTKTKTIHINQSKANNRTVAHEVFHAVLLDKVKTDKAAKGITDRMIKSLSKNLEGMPEVKQALDTFAANYDENIQSEEKLAELVGILAGNYAQMNKPSQSLIKRFLDRLAKMFGLKPFTDNEVVDVLNAIAGKVAVGEEISDVDIKVISKNKTAEIKEANKRFQADFTDLKSGVTYSFDKNTNEFKKIEQKYITRNKSISDFNNVFMILHQPDSAFSGKISKKLSDGSEILVEGKGGIFYPIKFHEKGYFWASTSKAAQAMAESMNKAINKDGKIYMALTTAPTNKVLSSTNAANGVMNLFISLSKNPKFKITGIESILIKSYDKAFGNKIDSSNNLDEIVKIIEEKLGAEKSSFDDRKTFSTSIIDSVVKSIQRKKSNQDAQNSLADFFGEGMMAEDLVTKFKKGSKISKANLTEAVSQMLTEPMLRDGKSKTENGSIYAILEIEGEVEAVDAKSETDHESYPKAIKSKGDSKTTLHLLTDRVKWNNVTIDPDTGKTVNKSGKVKSKDPKKKGRLVERWTQIMSPSAGITTQGVKIDTSEVTTPAKRQEPSIREQKDDGPSRERVDKIIDGIVQKLEDRRLKKLEKDRTRGPLTAKEKLDATISYLKGSKLYQESTDLEREQIVRQLTEDLGIKIKKAPSVRKVLGKKKRTKVVVDQLAEYKRQIKEWNKSARLAKKDLNTRRKELAKLVKSMVRQGIMTSKQAGILVERSNIVNLENEEILNRFLDYAEKVFKNAEYAEKLRQASAIRKKIKRNLKKDNQAEVIAMAKQFAEIDPQMVEVLDLYMDYAEQMNDALKSSRIKGGEVDMRQAANLAEIAEFYQGAIDNQNKILKKEMIAKYQDLNLDENMSINEIKEIVEAIESGDVKQGLEAEVMSFLTKRFGVMSAIAKDMIKRNINPFTGETIDLTDHQIDMVSRLVDADLSTMDLEDAIKFVEYIDNFITNEITSGLESAISIYEGVQSIRNLSIKGIIARMPKLGFSENVGKIWNQYLTSMPVLFDRIFQGTNRGLKVMKEIGLQDIINGKAKKIRVHKNIMDQYKKEFIEGDKKFMEAENVYERGMIAFMSRNLVGTVAEQKAEFERRKRLVLESIEYLENSGNKQERKKAEVYREVYGKLDIASAKDINSITDKASKKNIDAVSWWTDQWADKYNDLADVSLSVHNTILGTDTNYTPDKYKTLSNRVDISKEDLAVSAEKTSAFMSGTHIDRNKSGVLMETTRPKTLPKNRYVSFDFDMDNSLSMDKALTDIYTSAAIQKFYGATRSSSFEEVFGDTSSMVLERVSDYIRDLKGKGEYMSNKEISKIFNTVAKFGVSKALGGMSQALKQTIPVMMNTITNAGRFDFANKSDLDWVNNSDMAIVNRGIESETAIESADASVEVNLDNIRTIMRGVDKLQGLYLKAFLQGPDVYVAKSSFISYYKQHMQRNGLSTELVEGEYNQDALEYAQMMVDRQQNVSDPALAGTFLSKAGNVAIVRKVIAPFASFVINQKGRMMADLRVLNPTNTTPTNEDKKAAARSLAGLMVELTVFHTLSAVIREGFKGAAKGLFGDDDEDKEEKEWGSLESNKKFWDASSYAFSSVAKDVLSPFPFVGDGLVSEGLNMLLENLDVNLADEDDVQAAIDAENELRLLKRKDPMTDKEKKELREKVMEQGKISVYEDDAVLKTLGVLSIGKDAIKDLNDAYMLYKNGEYEQQGAFGKKKRYVLERDREGLGSIILGKFFTVTGLAPKDVGDIARYGMKEIKKKSISEKQYEKYQEVKKDLKRNPTEAEEYLIVNSGRKAKDITDDINRINKYFEGLTLDQMKEFVETEKYGLFRGSWAIRNIKEGKTAKELTKERNIPTESKSMFSTRKGE